MGRIRVLPAALVNKLAAGEVVERPASAVKELMENALDAGATRIGVAIEDGGRQLIRVSDNGCGISADDLRPAISPHATGKIVAEADLESIATMGFRGEALAALAAVSSLRLLSRPADAVGGAEIVVRGNEIQKEGPAGCPAGTTVEVRDLFGNVPARRKFLRGASTESGHVNEQFTRLALAHPEIAVELMVNGRSKHQLAACSSARERVTRFFGAELGEDLMVIDRRERGLRILALAAPPARSRAAGSWQYFYVNGRYVRDRFIAHAVREAYRGLIQPVRYPVIFLFLSIDPSLVDVNVHPTKIEVRWHDSNLIHSQVLSALREKFQRCDFTPAMYSGPRVGANAGEHDEADRRAFAEKIKAAGASLLQTGRAADGPLSGAAPQPSVTESTAGTMNGADMWKTLYRPSVEASPHARPEATERNAAPVPVEHLSDPAAPSADARPERVIQLHNAYLVAETDEGMIIIDQHALHERVIYEQLKDRLTNGPLESQRLLLPETLSVTPQQLALLHTHAALLTRLGVEVSPFGPDAIAIQSFPALLADTDAVAFVRDLLDRLTETRGATSTEVLLQDLLAMAACKAAVKAGDPLTVTEIEALIARRHLIDKPSNCPHGRPTTLRMSVRDLERHFKRK